MQLSNGETAKQQIITQKKRRNPWSTVAMVFLLLFVITAALAAWFWYMWQDNQVALSTANETESAAEQTIANLRQELGKTQDSLASAANSVANKTGEEMIKSAAKNHNDLLATPLQNATVKIDKTEANQAIATVSDNGGGAYKAWLKKSDGMWAVVWSGQNTMPADMKTQYGMTIQ